MFYQSMKQLKIGFMGSSCSGKTTTARALAKHLGIYLQSEIESELLLDLCNSMDINKSQLNYKNIQNIQDKSLLIRRSILTSFNRIVTDRTPLELLVYNENLVQPYKPRDYCIDFENQSINLMKEYTYLFLFPKGILEFEDNGIRRTDRKYQSTIHSQIIDKLHIYNIKYINLTPKRLFPNERVKEIMDYMMIK